MADKRTHSFFENGKFENRWDKWPFGYWQGPIKFCKWIYSIATRSSDREGLDKLKIMEPYFKNESNEAHRYDFDAEDDFIRATWLGHASVLVEIDGFRVLCDPIFGSRCPPYVGPKRFRDAPCKVKDLPSIDAVLISHNHYDHMDSGTINEISVEFPGIKWFIPKNDRANLNKMISSSAKGEISEMDWWETVHLKKTINMRRNSILREEMDETHDVVETSLEICFTPTQHWSNRGVCDSFKSLWGSWALKGPKHSFWFGGDTGYCGAFKEIGDYFGHFDMAAIPIGAYEPRDLTKFQHVNPEEAIMIHKDIRSKHSFGIHWGTFQLTSEAVMDPKKRLDRLVENENDVSFVTMNHGETMEIKNGEKRIFSSNNEVKYVSTCVKFRRCINRLFCTLKSIACCVCYKSHSNGKPESESLIGSVASKRQD